MQFKIIKSNARLVLEDISIGYLAVKSTYYSIILGLIKSKGKKQFSLAWTQ